MNTQIIDVGAITEKVNRQVSPVALAIAAVEAAASALGAARAHEQTLEDQRPLVKSAAIRRLMGTDNPETAKPHSASSAEKVVESDAEYFAHRQQQASAVVATEEARGAFYAARYRAELALAHLKET